MKQTSSKVPKLIKDGSSEMYTYNYTATVKCTEQHCTFSDDIT